MYSNSGSCRKWRLPLFVKGDRFGRGKTGDQILMRLTRAARRDAPPADGGYSCFRLLFRPKCGMLSLLILVCAVRLFAQLADADRQQQQAEQTAQDVGVQPGSQQCGGDRGGDARRSA